MAAPARHFEAILARPRVSRQLLGSAGLVVVSYAILLYGAIVASHRSSPAPRVPRSSLVVTLLDAPQLGLTKSLGEAGSAPRAAPGSAEAKPRLVGPERRVARPASVPRARPEAEARTIPSLPREDHVGAAATQQQGEAALPLGKDTAPSAASTRSAAAASVGSLGAGASGATGSSLRAGDGTGSGAGSGTSGAHSGRGQTPGIASGDAQVLPFRDGMARPVLLEKVDPVYTREARDAQVSGLILSKCVITTSGTLERCRIVKGIPAMDQAVLRALAKWRYTPVVYQGQKVAVEYVIPVRLILQ
jgi:TonB family protein